MRDRDFLGARFEQERPQLRRIAYRMLGTLDDADDAVQEAWIRLSRTDESSVQNLGAWLKTVVSRVCLDSSARGGRDTKSPRLVDARTDRRDRRRAHA
jgi:RNA polymerase sigma-70 factor (ECF subfamily)